MKVWQYIIFLFFVTSAIYKIYLSIKAILKDEDLWIGYRGKATINLTQRIGKRPARIIYIIFIILLTLLLIALIWMTLF